ncbi:MAG: hypothetical protein Q4E55_03895 [Bacteroidales bacterium]|nr:hypothetical protein [Bacteroidales bacterium]
MRLLAPASTSFFLSIHLKVMLSVVSLLAWICFMQSSSDLLMAGVVVVSGAIVTGLSNFYHILEKRDWSPFLLVWWTSGAMIGTHTFQEGSLSLLAYALALLCFMACYSREKAPVAIFNMCVALTVGAMCFPPMLFLLPLSLFGLTKISPITIQKLLASFVGILMPFWFMFAYTLLSDDCTFFMDFASQVRQIHFFDYTSIPMEQVVTFATTTLWMGFFVAIHIKSVHSFQLHTRLVFTCLAFFFVYIVALVVALPQHLSEFVLMEIVTGTLFVAYFVTHQEAVSPRLAMIINTLVFFVVLAVNVWKNLSTLGAIWD